MDQVVDVFIQNWFSGVESCLSYVLRCFVELLLCLCMILIFVMIAMSVDASPQTSSIGLRFKDIIE
jgi:hypothetical protein